MEPDFALPEVVEIEPTLTCNLRCRMCHVSFMPEEPQPTLPVALLDKLACLRGRHFILGSSFEPLMLPEVVGLLQRLAALEARLELITNGVLLSPEVRRALVDADLVMATISFDGISPAIYEHIRRRAKHAEVLGNVLALKADFQGRATYFAINSTMQRANFDEISALVDFWDGADFDLVRFITMVVRVAEPELVRASLYPERFEYAARLSAAAVDVIARRRRLVLSSPYFRHAPLRARYPRNFREHLVVSDHPAARPAPRWRQEAQLGAGPGMSFPCRSPWTFARIQANGDVQLCYQFTIGNLHHASFEQIWFGARATAVRQRVRTEARLCSSCDYYRFCLRSATVDPSAKESYFAGPLLAVLDAVDFATGAIPLENRPAPPRLVESRGNMNIVAWHDRYLAVPQALGPIELDKVDPTMLPGIVLGESLQEVRRRLQPG